MQMLLAISTLKSRPIKTTNVHGSRLQYEANLKENDSAHGFVVETRRNDVINDDTFVAKRIILPRDKWNKLTHEQKDRLIAKRHQECITGEDISMKKGASKYVMEHDLEESMPDDDYESFIICPPHGEYDAYQIDIDYSNVSFKDIDMIGHLADSNGGRKPLDKIHERTKAKQERNEQLIADKHGYHEGLGIGNNSDPQSDFALLNFDKHRFVGDTYDDDDGDNDEDDDNHIDGNDIDDDVDAPDKEEEE
jgi:hypothetical protein